MVVHLKYNPNYNQNGVVQLPYSKSMVNRLLILSFPNSIQLEKEQSNDDIKSMQKALQDLKEKKDIHIEEAGTVLRFILALAASTPGYQGKITMGNHLATRTILPLIQILQKLGAQIELNENEIKINGMQLFADTIKLGEQMSSQFISALMMVAPNIEGGLNIKIHPQQSSFSYVQLTVNMMKDLGFRIETNSKEIRIEGEKPEGLNTYSTDKDASASTFFLALALLNPGIPIKMSGLNTGSWQAESILFKFLSQKKWIKFAQNKEFTSVMGSVIDEEIVELDFSNYPDAALNIIIAMAILQKTIVAHGLESLNLKESKRLEVLLEILKSMNYRVKSSKNSLTAHPDGVVHLYRHIFNCHNDHRVAMALALISTVQEIEITGASCVSKSYPYFWEEIKKTGFNYA